MSLIRKIPYGGKNVIVMFPKNERLARMLKQVLYEKVGETNDSMIFKGPLPLDIDADILRMGVRSFIRFCEKVHVDGGRKLRKGGHLFIEPYRTVKLNVRMSEEEYSLLSKVANMAGRKPTTLFRTFLLSALAKMEGV